MTQSLSQFINWYRENEEKISKGPWEVRQSSDERPYIFEKNNNDKFSPLLKTYRNGMPGLINAEAIVQFRNTMPDIVAALEEVYKILKGVTGGFKMAECSDDPVYDSIEWLKKYFPSEES